jgi:hypothetical protein
MPPTGSRFTDWQQVDKERHLLMDEDFSWSEPPARPRRRRAEVPMRIRRRTAVAEAETVERDPRADAAKTHSEFDELMQRWNEAYGDASRGYRAPRNRGGELSYAGHASHYASTSHAEYASQLEAAGVNHGDVGTFDDDDVATFDDDDATFDRDDVASYTQAPVREDDSGAFELSGPYDLVEPGSRAIVQSDRRTVVITGRGDDRYVPAARRRGPSSELRFHERSSFSPDRAAMWAVLLGLALLIGAVVH